MKNKLNDIKKSNIETQIQHKNGIAMSLIALGLDLISVVIGIQVIIGIAMPSFVLLPLILSPIAGVIIGVIVLNREKGQPNSIGTTIAKIAVVVPIVILALIFIAVAGTVAIIYSM